MKFRSFINSVGSWLERQWLMSKFDFLPGEFNFLESTWYECVGWKKLLSGRTTVQYLDMLVRHIESRLSNPKLSATKVTVLKDFHTALHNPLIREEIVVFLDKPAFHPADCAPLWQSIYAAWRTPVITTFAPLPVRDPISTREPPSLPPAKPPLPPAKPPLPPAGMPLPMLPRPMASQAGVIEDRSADASGEGGVNGFHAKTFVIAAQIHFELAGKEPEYETLSLDLALLDQFIREQFKVPKLPGTFSKLKGYSYKRVLEGKNMSKKGQLKPCLRQITEHPQVFGEDISCHTRKLLSEHFEG